MHQKGCKEIHKGKRYFCECGAEFSTPNSLYVHQSYCERHLGYKPKKIRSKTGVPWNKGLTKEDPIYGESIRKSGEAAKRKWSSIDAEERSRISRKMYEAKTKESFINQGKTFKKHLKEGKINLPKNIGRGNKSYIIANNKLIHMRSKYEFIFALYLLFNDIDFEYESVRVEYKGSIKISDFYVNNNLYEIKGRNDKVKEEEIVKAFKTNGYAVKILYYNDLIPCIEFLKESIDLDYILKRIVEMDHKRNYYVINFDAYKSGDNFEIQYKDLDLKSFD